MSSGFVLVEPGRWQIDKDPQASLVYGIDVADVLGPGDELSGTPLASAPADTVSLSQVASTGTVVHARISGGAVGQQVPVTFTWQTVSGDTDQRTIYLRIIER